MEYALLCIVSWSISITPSTLAQACTDIGVQVPKQLFFELVGGELRPGSSKPEAGEEDAWGFNLDIKELNVVIRL